MRVTACLTAIVLLTVLAGTNQVSVRPEVSLNVTCGENVALTCSIGEDVRVLSYYWADSLHKRLCDYTSSTRNYDDRIHCQFTEKQDLILNIERVSSNDSGTYNCFVMANTFHGEMSTLLHVSACIERNESGKTGQTRSQSGASEIQWIGLLILSTSILTLVLDSGI